MVAISDEPVTLGKCEMCYENHELYEITIGCKKLSISSGNIIEVSKKHHICSRCREELKSNL